MSRVSQLFAAEAWARGKITGVGRVWLTHRQEIALDVRSVSAL
jgi:hypothetical protein